MKRKFFTILLTLVLALGVFTAGALAVNSIDGNWTYTVSNNCATITGYIGSSKSISIPSKVDGYEVTGIGASAFAGSSITSVTIPESITSIGNCAFKNCTELSSITINAYKISDCSSSSSWASLTADCSVFYNAGANSNSLTVTFGSNVKTIPAYLFATGANYNYGDGTYAHITSVVIGNNTASIGDYAFYDCYDLKSVTIADSVEGIGSYAFSNCTTLSTVSWGSGLQTIGSHAFDNSGINTLVIPKNTTSIGNCAFKNCTELSSITINAYKISDCSSSSSWASLTADCSVFYNAGANSNSLTVTFGSNVKTIPAYLFATGANYNYGDGAYAHITNVYMENGTVSTGNYAFYNCYDLKTLEVADSVESIGTYAFANCQNLSTVSWGSGLQTIGSHAFDNSGINTLVIPKNTTSIGDCAFKNCTELSSITINAYKISDCSSSSSWASLTADCSVFYNAGANSNSLTVTFGSNVKTIPAYLFATGAGYDYGDGNYAHITDVYISNGVQSIGNYAFYNCYDLKNVYYEGKQTAWNTISIGSNNSCLTDASMHYSATIPEAPTVIIFIDVPNGAYYTDAVTWAVENNITNGTGNREFSPDRNCTRAEIVTFLWRAFGEPKASSNSTFSDVSSNAYYADAVAWAVANNITNGTGDGKFSPDRECTRAEIVTFLWRAFDEPSASTSSTFSDVSKGQYYTTAVSWAVDQGITDGTGDGKFSPDRICTRAEIVTFLWRAMV